MVERAILLAAGAGTRLRPAAAVKPLASVAGRPLLHHALATLAAAGIRQATVVTGHGASEVTRALEAAPLAAEAVFNPAWESAPNGVSCLATSHRIEGPTLLVMADHLFDSLLVKRLIAGRSPEAPLSLAVDRRLGHPWVDEADVTRVRTSGRAILGIGKGLLVYDAYDTGVFVVTPRFTDALRTLPAPSVSDGVRALGAAAEAVDTGDARWLDVDDPRALALARRDWGEA